LTAIPPAGAGLPPVAPGAPATGAARSRAITPGNNTPALWQVLTDEERAYFESMAAMGPVSYGPGGRAGSAASAPLGQRIDVTG